MKPFLIALLSFLSLCSFGKGGGGHASSSSHASPESVSHASPETISHESAEHLYSPTITRTYFVHPSGIYWTLLLNRQTHKMDTICASSKEDLDRRVSDLSGENSIQSFIWIGVFMVVILIILIIICIIKY